MTKIKLRHTTLAQASQQVINSIEEERSGEQTGMKCRYNALNIAMGKYFRFANVNLIAGLSGHGKSYLLNILGEDFTDEENLNKNLPFVPILLHFCFEMSARNELLRTIAGDMGVSYSYLLSSEYDKDSKGYNQLTDAELLRVQEYLKYYQKRNILFFESPGNIQLIYNTVEFYFDYYTKQLAKVGKKPKFIVNIDHTLLIDILDEKSTLDLMANVGKVSISLNKDFEAMVNLLGQLNNNIEDIRRLTKPELQYPQKSDIYAQSQLYNACDNVFVVHQPRLLKLTQYGADKRDTKDLIHLIKLKSRHGKVGSIWLKNNLNNGKIEEFQKIVPNDTQDDKTIQNI